MAQLRYWIWLTTLVGVRSITVQRLMERFGGPMEIFFGNLDGVGELNAYERTALANKDMSRTENVLEKCRNDGIRILTVQDALYPERLRQIADPPPVLYVRGTLPFLDELPAIAVVGTRKATPYGLKIARQLGQEITAGGGCVVTGMASGIDGAAAGYMASAYQLIGIVSNFFAPMTAGKLRDQRPLTGAVGVLYTAGAVLMLLGKSAPVLWCAVLLCGFGTGCCFSLCMALIGMRTRNAQDASRLSGMLQTVGYVIAALGPVLVGSLLDLSGGWTLPLTALLAGVLFCGVMGQLAGRPGVVE